MTRKDFIIMADFLVSLHDVLTLGDWKSIVYRLTNILNNEYTNFNKDTFFKYINKHIWETIDW